MVFNILDLSLSKSTIFQLKKNVGQRVQLWPEHCQNDIWTLFIQLFLFPFEG